MLNLIATGSTYLFPGGRALKLVKDGINFTNSKYYFNRYRLLYASFGKISSALRRSWVILQL